MNGLQYLNLVADARAFRQTASLVEHELRNTGARQDDRSPLGGPSGWPSHNVWKALKNASHFNLGISFELSLKCLICLSAVEPHSGTHGHRLAKLLDQLPPDSATTLADLFLESLNRRPIRLHAFQATVVRHAPSPPENRDLRNLREFCDYLDEDVSLWKGRYAWEQTTASSWQHYIDPIDALLNFLDRVEAHGAELAKTKGILTSSCNPCPPAPPGLRPNPTRHGQATADVQRECEKINRLGFLLIPLDLSGVLGRETAGNGHRAGIAGGACRGAVGREGAAAGRGEARSKRS